MGKHHHPAIKSITSTDHRTTRINPLYFVTVLHQGDTIMGGHWYAADAEAARQLVSDQYIKDCEAFEAMGKTRPDLRQCEVKARRSTSYTNALNPEAA